MSNTIIVSAPGPQGPAGSGPGGSISDGDKGDITVSASGATWTIDANAISTAKIADDAVTFAKLQNITGPTVLGRQTGTGSTEQIGLAAALTINGSKQLDLANALAAQSLTLTAGTGLTGGGDLTANRTFAVAYGTTSGTACQGNDSRLSDARTPTAHTHAPADIQQGGATSGQVLEWSGSAWAPATLSGGGGGTVTSVTAGDGLLGGTITGTGTIDCNFGNTGNTICEGNDQRLSDARTPTAHTHAAADINSGTLDIARVPTGTSGTTVCVGNDARLSDARTPTAHTHDATDSYVGEIATPTARNYTIDLRAATARTISELYFITSAGTVDLTLQNGANTIYTADGLGTTKTSVTSGLSNASLAAGGTLTLTVDAVSTPADFQFVIVYTRTTGSIS